VEEYLEHMEREQAETRSQVTSVRPYSCVTSGQKMRSEDFVSAQSSMGSRATKLTLLEQELNQERQARRLLEREMK